MGHDVKYAGKLTPVKPLSEDEIKLFKLFQDDSRNYDRLYALEYKNEGFMVDDSNEKIYPDNFFDSIKKYIEELKKGGNDLAASTPARPKRAAPLPRRECCEKGGREGGREGARECGSE